MHKTSTSTMLSESLLEYIETQIIPRYDAFDLAHRVDHVRTVIDQSLALAEHYDVERAMVYAIAAYHDTGLIDGRDAHHLHSGRILHSDAKLREWFSEGQIITMREAVEDHRASSDHAPRSIYGRIVAEADRVIDPQTILRRTVQYGLTHYPTLDRERQYARCVAHLEDKYAEGGYLQLWIRESENSRRLEELRTLIRDSKRLRTCFDTIFDEQFNRLK